MSTGAPGAGGDRPPAALSGIWLPQDNTFGLVLKSALIREALGDMRRHGFVFPFRMSVLDSELTALFVDDKVKITDFRSRMLGLRSLRPRLPEATSWTRGIGWQLYVDYAWSKRRGLAAVLEAHYGLTFPLAQAPIAATTCCSTSGPLPATTSPGAVLREKRSMRSGRSSSWSGASRCPFPATT
jgi:hypothetical protein